MVIANVACSGVQQDIFVFESNLLHSSYLVHKSQPL